MSLKSSPNRSINFNFYIFYRCFTYIFPRRARAPFIYRHACARIDCTTDMSAKETRRISPPSGRTTVTSRTADAASALAVPRHLKRGILAGSLAGMTSQLLLFPLSTFKTRMQVKPLGRALRAADAKLLYRGLAPELLGTVPGTALFMATYEVMKGSFKLEPGYAAACGALAASVVLAPMETITRRMQVRRMPFRLAAAASARRGGLFVGFGSFLARELPFDMIQMSCFEWMKSRLEHRGDGNGKRALRARETAVLGGVAGAFTGLVTTPFDVTRTASVCSKTLGLDKTKSASDVARLMFRGAVPRMLEIGLGGIVYFSVIQATLRFLDDREDKMGKKEENSSPRKVSK